MVLVSLVDFCIFHEVFNAELDGYTCWKLTSISNAPNSEQSFNVKLVG